MLYRQLANICRPIYKGICPYGLNLICSYNYPVELWFILKYKLCHIIEGGDNEMQGLQGRG